MSEYKDGVCHGILFVLRRRFCGCKNLAHAAGMQARCCDEEAVRPGAARDAEAQARRRASMKWTADRCPRSRAAFAGRRGSRTRTRGMQALRHVGLPLPGREMQQAIYARRRFLGRTYRDERVVPAPGDKTSYRRPHAPRSHRQKRSQAGTIDPVRAVHACPRMAALLVLLGFFMSETMHPTRQ